MITVDLQALKLQDVASRVDPGLASRIDFPLSAATGTKSSAVVYFEIEPGKRLGMHRDSAEEIVLVLQGEAEATVDGERGHLTTGSMAVIPAMAPHDIANAGTETLRVVGFFAAATLLHAFYEPLLPNAEVAMFIRGEAGEEILAAAPFGG